MSLTDIKNLVDDLIEAHGDYLPEYTKEAERVRNFQFLTLFLIKLVKILTKHLVNSYISVNKENAFKLYKEEHKMKWSKNHFSLYSTRSNDLFDCLWKKSEDASGKVEIEFF